MRERERKKRGRRQKKWERMELIVLWVKLLSWNSIFMQKKYFNKSLQISFLSSNSFISSSFSSTVEFSASDTLSFTQTRKTKNLWNFSFFLSPFSLSLYLLRTKFLFFRKKLPQLQSWSELIIFFFFCSLIPFHCITTIYHPIFSFIFFLPSSFYFLSSSSSSEKILFSSSRISNVWVLSNLSFPIRCNSICLTC